MPKSKPKKAHLTKKDLAQRILIIETFLREKLNPIVTEHNEVLGRVVKFLDEAFPPQPKPKTTKAGLIVPDGADVPKDK